MYDIILITRHTQMNIPTNANSLLMEAVAIGYEVIR